MRKFEKVSYDKLKRVLDISMDDYEDIILPRRATVKSAGYDFYFLTDLVIEPGEIKLVPTGIKASMEDDEVLMLFVRSSMGFKYNIRLCNQVGIIDADYYNNDDNEGHIFVKIQNEGDETRFFKKGDRFVQGLFVKYLCTDADSVTSERTGGIGSTNKEG